MVWLLSMLSRLKKLPPCPELRHDGGWVVLIKRSHVSSDTKLVIFLLPCKCYSRKIRSIPSR